MVQDASIAPLVALKFLELEEMSRTPPLDPPVRQATHNRGTQGKPGIGVKPEINPGSGCE